MLLSGLLSSRVVDPDCGVCVCVCVYIYTYTHPVYVGVLIVLSPTYFPKYFV